MPLAATTFKRFSDGEHFIKVCVCVCVCVCASHLPPSVPALALTETNTPSSLHCTQFDENIRGRDVFVFQSCASPVNDSVMELLLTISCARRSGARKVIAVVPYFGCVVCLYVCVYTNICLSASTSAPP